MPDRPMPAEQWTTGGPTLSSRLPLSLTAPRNSRKVSEEDSSAEFHGLGFGFESNFGRLVNNSDANSVKLNDIRDP